MKRKSMVHVVALVCAAVALGLTGHALSEDPVAESAGQWAIEGVWVDEEADALDGAGTLAMVTRTGPKNLVLHWKSAKQVQFPGEATRTAYTGNAIRTGNHQWDFTLLSYIQVADGSVVASAVLYGRMWLVDDGRMRYLGKAAVFGFWQDPFGDDLPAYGCYGPNEGYFARMPIMQPCGEIE